MQNIDQWIKLGEENMKLIVGPETYEMAQHSTPMKLLFAIISPEPMAEGDYIARRIYSRKSEMAHMSSHGLIVNQKLYPYDRAYQTFLHRRMIQYFIKSSNFSEDTISTLKSFSQDWKDSFLAFQYDKVFQELDAAQQERNRELRDRMNALYMGNTDKAYQRMYLAKTFSQLGDVNVPDLHERMHQHENKRNRKRTSSMREKEEVIDKRVNDEIPLPTFTNYEPELAMLRGERNALQSLTKKDGVEQEKIDEANIKIEQLVVRISEIGSLKREESRRYTDAKRRQRALREEYVTIAEAVVQDELEKFDLEFSAEMLEKYHIQFIFKNTFTGMIEYKQQQFHNYLVEQDILDRPAIRHYVNFQKNRKYIIDKIIEHAKNTAIKQNRKRPSVTTIRDTFNDLHTAIKVKAGEDYFIRVNSLIEAGAKIRYILKESLFFQMTEGKKAWFQRSLPVELARTEDLMKTLFPENPPTKVADWYHKYIEMCSRYYQILIPLKSAEMKWGTTPSSAQRRVSKKIEAINAKFYANFPSKIKKETTKRFNDLLDRICQKVIGVDHVDLDDIIMLPTGFVLFDENLNIKINGFHPMELQIKEIMDESTWNNWCESWNAYWKKGVQENNPNKFALIDDAVRTVINQHLAELISQVKTLSPIEEKFNLLVQQYQTVVPTLIREKTGKFVHIITQEHVELLERILPQYSMYIGEVNVSSFNMDVTGMETAVKSFVLSSRDDVVFLMTEGKYLSLNINSATVLDERDADGSLFATGLAIKMYRMMDLDLRKQFSDIIGEKLNISKIDLFRHTGVKIDSLVERRNYMSRVHFVNEFRRYVQGSEVSSELRSFFADKVDALIQKP